MPHGHVWSLEAAPRAHQESLLISSVGSAVMTGIEGRGFTVVGMTIEGPPPIGRIHLDLTPDLSVLYGHNAVGKTRFLSALAATMQGFSFEGAIGVIHVIVHDPEAAPKREEGFPGALLDGLRVASSRLGWNSGTDPESSLLGDQLEGFEQVVQRCLSSLDTQWKGMEQAIVEAAAYGSFSLRAVGHAHPEWEIWISDCIRPESVLNEAYCRAGPLARANRSISRAVHESFGNDLQRLPDGLRSELLAAIMELQANTPWATDLLEHLALRDFNEDLFFVRPSWVPVELARAGTLAVGPVDVIPIDEEEPELNSKTARLVAPDSGCVFAGLEPGAFSMDTLARVARLGKAASLTLSSLIGPGRTMRFELGTPQDWFLGAPPGWVCEDEYGLAVPLAQLSKSRRRWAVVAVRLALGRSGKVGLPAIVLSDEPEAGLHRTAEAKIASGLTALTSDLTALTSDSERTVIVASHSPAFMSQPSARLLRVHRDVHGTTQVVEQPGLPDAYDLGLTETDVLSLQRVFVIVEGEHDELVLAGLFPGELRRAFAKILVLRGASRAKSAAHAEWLLSVTSSPFLIVIDKLDEQAVQLAWAKARIFDSEGRIDDAIRALGEIKNVRKDEAGFLRKLGEEALQTGMFQRLHFLGLNRDDILLYLPDGRELLERKRQGTLTSAQVKAAVRSVDSSIDPDLTGLMAEISRLAGP